MEFYIKDRWGKTSFLFWTKLINDGVDILKTQIQKMDPTHGD